MIKIEKNIAITIIIGLILVVTATLLFSLNFNNEKDWGEIANDYKTYEEEKSQACLSSEVLAERFVELIK